VAEVVAAEFCDVGAFEKLRPCRLEFRADVKDALSTCRFQYFASIISTICVNSDVAPRGLRLKLADINPALAPICRGPALLSIGQPFLARAG